MPPLGMHMTLARDITRLLKDPHIEYDAGAYYLGSTAPDIRVLTRWERERTHFFRLDCYDEQDSVRSFLRAHPYLARPSELNGPSVSFLAGYISHLAMDETWIVEVYRPCFGPPSPLRGDALANVMDRVLQYELDRRDRLDRQVVEEIRESLLRTTVDISVGFLDAATLARWRDLQVEVLSRPPSWDRFKWLGGRFLAEYGVRTDEDLQEFLKGVPDMLEECVRQVTLERIQAFRETSLQKAREAIREYLS